MKFKIGDVVEVKEIDDRPAKITEISHLDDNSTYYYTIEFLDDLGNYWHFSEEALKLHVFTSNFEFKLDEAVITSDGSVGKIVSSCRDEGREAINLVKFSTGEHQHYFDSQLNHINKLYEENDTTKLKEFFNQKPDRLTHIKEMVMGTGNAVEHPNHYNKGIECWDYIMSHDMDFMTGNCIKYLTRWKNKNGLEDLKKARQYIEKMIKTEELKIIEE